MAQPVMPARVVRSGLEESVHVGHVVVCDSAGRLVASAGDPDRIVFARSAMKPLQAADTAGALERFAHPPVALLARASTMLATV